MENDITSSTDDKIKYNLELYFSYICEYVKAPHLLQHLDYYTSAQRVELNKLSRTCPVEASSKAFRVLMNDATPGIFTALMQSLSGEYPRVIKLLTGDIIQCDENYRKIITHFTPEIIKQIQPMELLPYLRRYDVLTDEDMEETKAEKQNYGPIRAAWIIVLNIHRHREDWFKCFLMSLMETDCEDLAITLDPDMVEKITNQREFASANGHSEAEKGIGSDVVKENVQEVRYEALRSTKVLNTPSPVIIQTTLVQSNFNDGNAIVKSGKSDSNVNISGSYTYKLYDEKAVHFDGIDDATDIAAADLTDLKKVVRSGVNGADGGDTAVADDDDVTVLKQISRSCENNGDSGNNDDMTILKQFSRSSDNDSGANVTALKQLSRSSDNDSGANVTALKQVVRLDDHDCAADLYALQQVVRPGDKESCEDTDNESSDSNIDDDLVDFNDLDEILPGIPAITISNNILTDVNHITGSTEHSIDLRGYQEKLSRKGCEGENVIIMAPTNSGKTKVACQIIFSSFERCKLQNKEGKAAFIVDKEELAFQQGKVFVEELPGYRTKVVTGDVQQSKNQNLKDYVHRRDILVVTAQVLLNCLKAKELRGLEIFNILVFDECHHTDKKHPYKEIMDIYFERKLAKPEHNEMPQIVGLTASIGVGGTLNRNNAFNNMKQIAANLDTYELCTIDDIADRKEMKEFINDPEENIIAVPRRKTERFYEDVLEIVKKIDTFMMTNESIDHLEADDRFIKAISSVPTVSTGTCQFQSWLSDFKQGLAALKSDEARQVLSPCWCYLERYHLAVMLYNDARIQDALRSLESFVDERRRADYNNEADDFLLKIFDNLKSNSYSTEPENPKLLKLKEIVVDTMRGITSARGIIFVKTRDIAMILKQWMHESEELKPLNAKAFLGQVVSSKGGMTKSKQRDVLALFKNGRYKIIIATTVAEEGLDIAKCNLVIKYEHVTDEKARVQCRGRARAKNSRYYVLTEMGSGIIEKEEFNARCEKLMEELVPVLKNYMEENRNRWEDEILEMQRNAKCMRELQLTQREAGRTAYLHCGNCGSLICCSDDIKKICGMHHIVISEDIRTRIVLERSLKPKHMDRQNDLTLGGHAYCSNKICIFKYTIGGIILYRKLDFPVLKITQLCVKDIDGNMLPGSTRQWNRVCFKIESIDMTDLEFIIRQRSLAL